MRKTLLLLFTVACLPAFAQIVNIPDANFKTYLLNYVNDGIVVNTNGDGEIQLSEALNIQQLQIMEHPILTGPFATLQGIEAFANLNHLSISSSVPNLNLSNLSNLAFLNLECTQLTSLNIGGLSNLTYFYIYMAKITNLDLSGSASLQTISITSDYLTSLTIGNNASLSGIWVHTTKLAVLDLSTCPNLAFLNVSLENSNDDVYVNLKNGNPYHTPNSSAIHHYNYSATPYKMYVCLDEGELQNISFIEPDALISTYCTFEPGGSYNTISGTSTFNGGSGCNSSLPGIRYNVSDGSQSGSVIGTQAGNYSFFSQAGTITITPQLENNTWFTASPPSAQVTFTNAANNTAIQNFCMSAVGIHPDIEVMARPIGGAQPGFDTYYEIIYRNKGNQALTGAITMTFDDSLMDFASASVTPASAAIGMLTWNYPTIQPFETRSIVVTMNMNAPTETPPLNLGDNLTFTVAATPVAGDENPADNTFTLSQVVTGSFDPNDITCLEGDTEHPDNIGKYLHYNVNFENTGTAPATFIVVKDIIDAAKFDVTSLQLINASHNVQTRINGNKVEFYFDAINLGPNQKGSLLFKIKTLPTLSVNSSVTQNANIYFDYNLPITTNNATTTFQLLNRGNFAQDTSVKIYPNPSASVVNITAATPISSLQLYDLQGRLLEAVSPKLNETTVDISQRTNGIYFLKISTENGVKVEKLVKQ